MPSQVSTPQTIHARYVVPKIELGVPGRQARTMRGAISVVPGYSHPFEFVWGDLDGVPLNLLGLKAMLAVWAVDRFGGGITARPAEAEVLLRKPIEIVDPHAGLGSAMLSADDTKLLGLKAEDFGLSWSVTLYDDDNAFLCTVTESGATHGSIQVERTGIPDAQSLLGVT